MVKNIMVVMLILIGLSGNCSVLRGRINLRSKSSTVKIKSGGTLVADQPIRGFSGHLVKEQGGTISGQAITFDQGVLEEEGNKLDISGDLNPSNNLRIELDGNKTFRAKRGEILQSLFAQGQNNRLEGFFKSRQPIILKDSSTSVTCVLEGRLSNNIELNGGTLFLEEDLRFVDDKSITGSGRVNLNKHKLSFGAKPLTWNGAIYFEDAADVDLSANLHLAETWTFSGSSVLNGNGNILYLESGGEIVVDNAASLEIRDIVIQNVAGNNIRCMDSLATITFQDVRLIQSADYSFTEGAFVVLGNCKIEGGATFAYQAGQTSTIKPYSQLKIDENVTFSYDPIVVVSKTLLAFEDSTAFLSVAWGNFHTTGTGIQLTKGTMWVKGESLFSSEKLTYFDGITTTIVDHGLIFGNDTGAEDFSVHILPGGVLSVSAGTLQYRNTNVASFIFNADSSILEIRSGATLNLYQSLSSTKGCVSFQSGGVLGKTSGVLLDIPLHLEGKILQDVLT